MKVTGLFICKWNSEKRTVTSRFRGQQDTILYLSAKVKIILEVKRAWHVVRDDDAASLSASFQDGTDARADGARAIVNSEFDKNVACSVTLQSLGEVSFACVLAYKADPRINVGVPTSALQRQPQCLARPPCIFL